MAKTRLFIRKGSINDNGTTVIYLRYSHRDASVDFSTKILIEPSMWDGHKQHVRKSCNGAKSMNTYLQSRVLEIESIKLSLLTMNTDPTVSLIKYEYEKRNAPTAEIIKPKAMLEYWDEFVMGKLRSGEIEKGTLKQYRSTLKILRDYETFAGIKMTFDGMDNNFYEQFKYYAYEELLYQPNTLGGRIKQLKTFLGWAVDNELTTNSKFRKFKKPTNESTFIALTQSQLNTLFYLDLSDNKTLDQSRDLFIIGCATGFRYSDFSQIKRANIQGDYLIKHIGKTKNQIKIPLNHYSRAILAKYPNDLPTFANGPINAALKIIGVRAGFTDIHEVVKFPGAKMTKEYKPLHELLVTHCARRTFATQSLERGMDAPTIMKITGHKSYVIFMRYLKTSEQRISESMNNAWPAPQL